MKHASLIGSCACADARILGLSTRARRCASAFIKPLCTVFCSTTRFTLWRPLTGRQDRDLAAWNARIFLDLVNRKCGTTQNCWTVTSVLKTLGLIKINSRWKKSINERNDYKLCLYGHATLCLCGHVRLISREINVKLWPLICFVSFESKITFLVSFEG